MTASSEPKYNDADFDWVQLKKDCSVEVESKKDKLIRKISENPLVPIGKNVHSIHQIINTI